MSVSVGATPPMHLALKADASERAQQRSAFVFGPAPATSDAFKVDGPLSRMLARRGTPSSNELLHQLKSTNSMTYEVEAFTPYDWLAEIEAEEQQKQVEQQNEVSQRRRALSRMATSRASREDERAKRAEHRLNERMEAMRLGSGDDGMEDVLRRSAGLTAKGDSSALSTASMTSSGDDPVESFTPDSTAPPSRNASPVVTRGSPNRSPLAGRRGARSPSPAFAGAKPASEPDEPTEPAAPAIPAAPVAPSCSTAASSPPAGTPSFEHQLALLVERLRSLRAAGLLAEPIEQRLQDVVGDCATLGALAAAFPRDDAAFAKQLGKCFKM